LSIGLQVTHVTHPIPGSPDFQGCLPSGGVQSLGKHGETLVTA
jgi:hypothetical protein